MSPLKTSAVLGASPPQSVAVDASASWATPHEAEATVAEVALTVPTDASVVVAVAAPVLRSSAVGNGDPLPQFWALAAVTEPPEPVPVE